MKRLVLLSLLMIPLFALTSLGYYNINIVSLPSVNPPAYSYFYLEFQFSPTNGTPQPYAIFVGNSLNNLTMVAEGYTFPNGTGYARVPVINSPVEYIDIVWVNKNYSVFQIFPQTVPTNSSSPVVQNQVGQGFNFNLPPWVSWVIGSIIILFFMALGWKFMRAGGLVIFGAVSIFLTSFFGLIPFYIIFIFVFIVAIIGARTIMNQIGGVEEE